MDLIQVKKILEENFNNEPREGQRRHIIFWYDGEGEFVEDIDELKLDNAKILKLTEHNAFYTKYRLEKEDTNSNYLVYSSFAKPMSRDNWLLDILKYSMEFSTDKAELIMRDFGVSDVSLKNVFKKYLRFFNHKERYKKFASYHIENFTEEKVDMAVLSALCKLPVVDLEQVVKKVLMGEAEGENKWYREISLNGDLGAFWNLIEKRYGYTYEDKSLQKLMVMFLTTHLSYTLEESLPKTWQEYISPKKSDCVVFVSNFMNHGLDGEVYDAWADMGEGILNVEGYLAKWDLDKYIFSDTFRAFDKKIIQSLINHLLENIGEFDQYRKVINARRTSHWFKSYENEYEAVYFAMALLEKEKSMEGVIRGQSAFELVENYTKEYYLLDRFYRKFYFYYDQIVEKEKFSKLVERVENTYTHWFLNELSVKWSGVASEELQEDYPVPGVPQQKDFYRDYISHFIKNKDRVFVIISDALRYEAGKELGELLNKEVRGAVEIGFMQGVVPSTTKFGMASLLPRRSIEIGDKGEIAVDGLNTQGTENRGKILRNFSQDALAISYQDMVDMKRPDYKETFEGRKLVYIYHNVIDAVGDNRLTEREVFSAVGKAFEDLRLLVKNLVNHVSATNIMITADHGFLYRRSPLKLIDKIGKHDSGISGAGDTVEAGRRYILGRGESPTHELSGTLAINMSYLQGKKNDLRAYLPKGVIRYKLPGSGANYVHGGLSLEEVIIPIIKFKNIRKDEYKAAKVEVKLTNISRKITNRITFLEFFQTDIVENKKLPLRLKLYFVDEEGKRISNENVIIADSKSKNPQERTYREKFTLLDMAYDKNQKYYLILEDEEEPVEKIYERIPFTIDLLISDDFGL
ncbi:BREX-1 system phosphatase PglZ type A [Dehalobacterium formicoaceticum]|uniref:BREX-1 system phosphatase PglZ type A n=1 Tax=Dehalobacterium formicoaceticum TaxID=51515 RepID=A0ABT1Y1G7_9FIRM|nr:BREX-1 system phosphatase PglZ type A [Dehalobacterium formicoaceticum]MCR6544418.1 BREX-1 system phosphatase PglZ type A [Dehalobacterium formicoaceticum]